MIAEYERAKIGERYRRGKLFRARAGEVISWKAPYGYRRVPRGPDGPAHLEIFEPEAAAARRIFAERAAGTTIRQICRQLNEGAVPTPTGSRAVWGTSTVNRLLRNEAYIGRVYFNRTEAVPDRRPGHRTRQVPRPRAEWIAIPCPAIITDQMFQAAGKASTDNAKWSPRRAEPGAWLLRGLVKCGPCGVGTSCHKMRGRNGTWHRYYYCHNHDPLRAGGQDRRCPERNIRADALDEFVFGQVRAALLDPALLLAGEQAIAVHAPTPDDQLLAAELARLDRKLEAARGEHRRLVDLYQAGLIDMPELQRRAAAITARQRELDHKRASLAAERADLARGNRLRHGVEGFAARVAAVMDQLDPAQQQKLLRLLIEDVQVTGWHIQIRLRIPLDNPPDGSHPDRPQPPPSPASPDATTTPVSTEDRLRSLHAHEVGVVQHRLPQPDLPEGHRLLGSQIHGLSANVVVPGLEGTPRHDVHSDTQEVLQTLEQTDVIKERRTWLEIHEQIEITVWVSLASSDRTEDGDPTSPPLPRDAEDLCAAAAAQPLHSQHVVGHPSRVTPRGLVNSERSSSSMSKRARSSWTWRLILSIAAKTSARRSQSSLTGQQRPLPKPGPECAPSGHAGWPRPHDARRSPQRQAQNRRGRTAWCPDPELPGDPRRSSRPHRHELPNRTHARHASRAGTRPRESAPEPPEETRGRATVPADRPI